MGTGPCAVSRAFPAAEKVDPAFSVDGKIGSTFKKCASRISPGHHFVSHCSLLQVFLLLPYPPPASHRQLVSILHIQIMSPTPISPNTIRIALQYILPPSQLDQPLPPYLLSKSLLQRHHFLNISPEDPCEYLCWPSSLDGSKAIDLLELTKPLDDDTPLECPIQYSSDDEYTYAHAHLVSADEPGVRLVFQWDEFDGWKYHDAKLMPFPPQSYPSLVHVTSPSSLPTAYAPPQSSQKDIYGLATNHGSSDDDDYWNAYGAQDIDLSPTGQHLSLSHRESGGDSEDAYWARYSSVHGKLLSLLAV